MTASTLPIGVLISGGGTTLRNLIERVARGELNVEIRCVVSSSGKARGLDFARQAGIPAFVVEHREFANVGEFSTAIFEVCRRHQVALVVCGGFLKQLDIPPEFEGRIVNIHPSLIPVCCGHGYYGRRVHEAVLEQGLKISGCTIHFVDNEFDHGPIILQRAVPVLEGDTAERLAARVFEAECEAYPEAIRLFAAGRLRIEDGRTRILDAD